MASKLVNGDYLKDENRRPLTVDYIEALLQNAFTALQVQRGRFYPNKCFGSRIRQMAAEPLAEYAFAYAAEALDGLDGVYVKSAAAEGDSVLLTLLLNDREGTVKINLENNV